jgi:hypothetical protein
MVRTFLKVYMELGSYFLFLKEQIKDIIIITRDVKFDFGHVETQFLVLSKQLAHLNQQADHGAY